MSEAEPSKALGMREVQDIVQESLQWVEGKTNLVQKEFWRVSYLKQYILSKLEVTHGYYLQQIWDKFTVLWLFDKLTFFVIRATILYVW